MSDKITIPSESWRAPRRQSRQMDPQMVRMGVIAAGVLGLVVIAAGGYALIGRRPHVIPVVEADSRPIRVRPDNPGGNMVVGADEQIMGGNGRPGLTAMAPPAEAPEPQALRAQIEASHAPPPVLSLPALQPVSPALPPAQKVSLAVPPVSPPSALSDMPETRPATKAVVKAPAVSAPQAAAAGGMQVQLGALESEQAAMTEWQRLSKRMPDLLGPRHPAVLRAEHDGKTVWRLRTGGFTDIASATAFCSQVKSKGVGCAIASF
jgi:hypothetical protein